MITSKYDWQLASPSADEAFLAIAKKAGLESSVATLLYERGIQTKEDLEDFLEPKLEKLHDPYLLHDMDKAVERIRRAIEDYEQILIYGDYDADGMTSASIMKETLEQMGAEVQVYLPNRFTDGYGPNESVYKYFIEQQGISLIVTVDNGVAGMKLLLMRKSKVWTLSLQTTIVCRHSFQMPMPLSIQSIQMPIILLSIWQDVV